MWVLDKVTPERRKLIHGLLDDAMDLMEMTGELEGEAHHIVTPAESDGRKIKVYIDLQLLLTVKEAH